MPDPAPPRPTPATVRELIRTNPEARRRFGDAYAWLLAWLLVVIVAFTGLVAWLLARRSRRLRDALGRPRPVRWPDPGEARGSPP